MTEETKATLAGFEGLSSEDFINSIMPDQAAAPAAKAPEVAAVPEAKKAEETPVVEKKAEEKAADPVAEVKKPEDKAVEKNPAVVAAEKDKVTGEEVKDFTPEFVVPGEEKKVEGQEEGEGWAPAAKEIGFEIPTDNFEEFKKGLDNHYKNKYDVNLGKYDSETQQFIEFLENGGTVQDFLDPLKPVEQLKSLSDVDLVVRDLELQDWPQDKIDQEIARMTEADKDEIGLTAFKLRKQLGVIEQNIKTQIIESKTKAEKRQDSYKQNATAEQLSAIKNSLNTVSEFMDTPLSGKHKDFIAKNWVDGKYANILNDPKAMSKFLLFHEFGEQGIANLKNKAKEEAKLAYKNDRHNIPPMTGTGGGQVKGASTSNQQAEGNWSALEGFNDSVFGK